MKKTRISNSITSTYEKSLPCYFKDIRKYSPLPPDEELELIIKAKNGSEEAKEKIIKANLKFVISIAKQYQYCGLQLIDLIQEGNLGLINSIKFYDETKGFKFISYAVWWIRQSIVKALCDYSRTIRVPSYQISNLSKINDSISKLEQEEYRTVYADDISELDNATDTINVTSRAISLETPLCSDNDTTILDITPDESIPNAYDNINNEEIKNIVRVILSKLNNRERDIVMMYYGINMCPMQTHDIAIRFGVTNERIRQILHDLLIRMKQIHNKIFKTINYYEV